MHELSIASAILDRAKAVSQDNGNARVTKVGLRIGEIAGVEADALRFGFEVLCKGTPMEATILEIELCERRQRCSCCATEFGPDTVEGLARSAMSCPSCAGDESVCIAGQELDVTFIELEDSPCA
jgi:hydrogenase nickel incorporation protein HypA/HybF